MAKLKDQFHKFISDSKRRRIYEREALALEAAELISRLIEEKNINRKQLADLLGTPKSNVTNLLSGARNMTMYSLADLAYALDHRVEMKAVPIDAVTKWEPISEQDMYRKGIHVSYERGGDAGDETPASSDYEGNIQIAA